MAHSISVSTLQPQPLEGKQSPLSVSNLHALSALSPRAPFSSNRERNRGQEASGLPVGGFTCSSGGVGESGGTETRGRAHRRALIDSLPCSSHFPLSKGGEEEAEHCGMLKD